MIISSKNGAVVTSLKQYVFSYLLASTSPTYNNPDINIAGDNSKRLFLTNLITTSPAGTELNRYTFEYYNPTELPSRLSYAVDHWGYLMVGFYQTDSKIKILFPKIYRHMILHFISLRVVFLKNGHS